MTTATASERAELKDLVLDNLSSLITTTLADESDPERFDKADVYIGAALAIKKGPIKSRDEYIKELVPSMLGLLKNQFAKMGFDIDITEPPQA